MTTATSRRSLRVTDEQFRLLFNNFPDDAELIAEACREALHFVYVPNAQGRTQTGVRVFRDDGWMGSGYILVHRGDTQRLSWAMGNGYTPNGFPEGELPIEWEEDRERERLLSIRATLREWSRP